MLQYILKIFLTAFSLTAKQIQSNFLLKINNKNKSKMKNKNLSFECKFEVKDNQEEDYYHLNGYGSTFGNIDRVNDVVEKGAFKKSLKKKNA